MTEPSAGTLRVERIGGVVGFGVGHLRSRGEIAVEALSAADRSTVDGLFDASRRAALEADRSVEERYRITRSVGGRSETVTVPFRLVPEAVRSCVKDTLI